MLESYDAWRARAEGDIAQGQALMTAHVPGYRPHAFAVSFGDYGQFHTNDSRIPAELRSFITGRFGAYFVQPRADPPFSSPGKEIWRYTVRSETRADDLYSWLSNHAAG